MFSIEGLSDLYYNNVLGIRKEFPSLNPLAAGLFVIKFRWYTWRHHSILEGSLPKTGATILASNHFHESDSYKIMEIGRRTAGRSASRAIVKMSLVYPNSLESADYLKSIGDEEGKDDYSFLTAFVLKGVGIIPIKRDNTDPNVMHQCNAILNSGQILGIYLQPHRYSDCILRNLQLGVATLAMRHRDTPVCPAASSGPPYGPDKTTIFPSLTYNQASTEAGRRLSAAEFTIILADIIASGLPQHSQLDWQTRREEEFQRLISHRR